MWTGGGSNSRCLTPLNSTAVRSPARRRGGRAGASGQQTTGPRALTANLAVLPRSVLTASCCPAVPLAYHRRSADACVLASQFGDRHGSRGGHGPRSQNEREQPFGAARQAAAHRRVPRTERESCCPVGA